MLAFLFRNRVAFRRISLCLALLTFCLMCAACAVPTWLSDAEGISALLVTAAGSIMSFIASLTGNVALGAAGTLIAAWGSKVEAGLQNINQLIEAYKKTPGESLLQEIEQAANAIQADLNSLGTIVGVPAAILTPLTSLSGLILNEIESLVSLLPLAQPAPTEGATVAVKIPTLTANFKAKVNAVLATPTADANVNAALAKVKKLK